MVTEIQNETTDSPRSFATDIVAWRIIEGRNFRDSNSFSWATSGSHEPYVDSLTLPINNDAQREIVDRVIELLQEANQKLKDGGVDTRCKPMRLGMEPDWSFLNRHLVDGVSPDYTPTEVTIRVNHAVREAAIEAIGSPNLPA